MKNECGSCVFWFVLKESQLEHKDDWEGICKRFPPIFDHTLDRPDLETHESSVYWIQPVTGTHDYCGEWKTRYVKR